MSKKLTTVKLGKTYRDRVFGFKGKAMAHCRYLTGCDHVKLVRAKEDGDLQERWVDIVRLEEVPSKEDEGMFRRWRTARAAAIDIGGPATYPPSRGPR